MLIENSFTGKKSFTRHNIFRDQKAKNYFTIVHSQHEKLNDFTAQEVWADFFKEKLDPLDTFLHYLIFKRKLSLSRVNCEEIEVEISRRKFQTS